MQQGNIMEFAFIKQACVFAILALHMSISIHATSSPPHPHILFVVIDDLGWDDVGFRSHQIRTPTIDTFAAKGRILDHYYVQDVCSPSRAAFQTGRYPLHNTVNDWLRSDGYLPVNETLIPQKLEKAGYERHAVGKWHLGQAAWEYTRKHNVNSIRITFSTLFRKNSFSLNIFSTLCYSYFPRLSVFLWLLFWWPRLLHTRQEKYA